VLCDSEQAVMGGYRYYDYAARIREEYAHLTGELFRRGRAEVLRRLLAAPRLYRTAVAYAVWEETARASMRA
jgi:predicted metal-dependent HD superfamily phosphohydrolase